MRTAWSFMMRKKVFVNLLTFEMEEYSIYFSCM